VADASAFQQVRGFGATSRSDAWWLQPTVTFLVLFGFIVYASWAGLQNAHYEFGNYLSPMYSPLLFGTSPHSWFGGPDVPTWWPGALPYSAAGLILIFPLGFRVTCYYYRGAYYKAFWADPPACAVGEPRGSYRGERWFPLVLQNVHRYFLYFAVIFLVILGHDAYDGFWFTDNGVTHFGIAVGTLVLVTNVTLLSGYTLGCHSMRHLLGGVLDVMSGRPVRKAAYVCSSAFNRAHMRWAWCSLVWVGFTDLYIRLCSMGIWHDFRIL
jgi:hypothetical protein